MTPAIDLSRRNVILIGGAGTALALAGCSTTPTDTGGAPADAGDGSADPTKSAGTPEELAKLADIPVGGSISAKLAGKPVLITQPTAGSVVAFSAICTHQGCVVKPAEKELDCPCHGSRYDSTTGEVIAGPAPRSLEKVDVTVSGDAVIAG